MLDEKYPFSSPPETMDDQVLMQLETFEALGRGDCREAARFLEDYEDEYGKDSFWRIACIDLKELENDPDGMLKAIKEAEKWQEDPVLLTMRYARYHFLIGDAKTALDYIDNCPVEEDSDLSLLNMHLKTFCYISLSEYAKAAHCIEDILLEVNDTRISVLCALCYLLCGQKERGREYLKANIGKLDDPDDPLYEILSEMDFDMKAIEENAEFIMKAVAVYSSDTLEEELDSDFEKTMAPLIREKPREVLGYLEYIFKESGPNISGYYMMGQCYSEIGQETQARSCYRKAVNMPYYDEEDSDREDLGFRLLALEKAGYSKSTVSKHLREFGRYFSEDAGIRMVLVQFALEQDLDKVASFLLFTLEPPVFENRQQEQHFTDYQADFYMDSGMLYLAYDLLKEMYPERQDYEYLTKMAILASAMDNRPLMEETAGKVMPHGLVAVYLLLYYAGHNCPRAYGRVIRLMDQALARDGDEIPYWEAYEHFLEEEDREEKE